MIVLTISLLFVHLVSCRDHIKIWNGNTTIEPAWKTPGERQSFIDNGKYVPSKNIIANIKLWKKKMYLTIPRWDDGIPVTLGVMSVAVQPNANVQKIEYSAYPNSEMQKIGDCDMFQSVHSIEIDLKGRMWVLDSGEATVSSNKKSITCSPRLVILDLENNGKVLRTHKFPKELTSASSFNLDDIILDYDKGGFAYISDNTEENPGIIVYSLRNDLSWKIRRKTMQGESASFYINRRNKTTAPQFISVMALSGASYQRKLIYYVPPLSQNVYSFTVDVLRNRSVDYLDSYLGTPETNMQYQISTMVMSANRLLYYGSSTKPALGQWDAATSGKIKSTELFPLDKISPMKQAYALDEYNYVWAVVIIPDIGTTDEAPLSHVYQMEIDSKNYQYYTNGEIPPQPIINSGYAIHSNNPMTIGMVIISVIHSLPALTSFLGKKIIRQ